MEKVQLYQMRMNQRSTGQGNICKPDNDDPIHGEKTFTPAANSAKTSKCYCAIVKLNGKIYTDRTSHFITLSITGNYRMILYDYERNHIMAHHTKN